MILMYPYFIALGIYLFINRSAHMLYIYSHYLIKLHDFYFFLQAHAGIFFSSSISCMNFFFGSDTPPPRISNGPPLTGCQMYTSFHFPKANRAHFVVFF